MNLTVNKMSFQCVCSPNKMTLTAKFINFHIVWFTRYWQYSNLSDVGKYLLLYNISFQMPVYFLQNPLLSLWFTCIQPTAQYTVELKQQGSRYYVYNCRCSRDHVYQLNKANSQQQLETSKGRISFSLTTVSGVGQVSDLASVTK